MGQSLRFFIITCLWSSSLFGQSGAPIPPPFRDRLQRHQWVLQTLMPWMEKHRRRFRNVPRSDGQFLHWLLLATERRRALEVGTANGYSALWLGLALELTGGKLITIEIDPTLARYAQENLQRAGLLNKVVTVVEGDALKVIPRLKGKFDFAFIDIGPRAKIFFDAVEPKLTKDAIVAIHKPPFPTALQDLLDALRQGSEWFVTVVNTGAKTEIVLCVRRSGKT